jgi:hypothetical protein
MFHLFVGRVVTQNLLDEERDWFVHNRGSIIIEHYFEGKDTGLTSLGGFIYRFACHLNDQNVKTVGDKQKIMQCISAIEKSATCCKQCSYRFQCKTDDRFQNTQTIILDDINFFAKIKCNNILQPIIIHFH